MNFLSVCSGIEAASVAWSPLGWNALAFSEIEPFPCAVLAHHYPSVPNFGDLTRYQEWPDVGPVDVLVGGTPCQSFSVAGLRAGLADPRGNLALVYLGLADRLRPRWLVWENVPGVLSSGGGRDFGAFLGALGKLGYGWAYRILDAQFFGLAQRRERVFVVGCLGDWRGAAAVLLEQSGLRGDPAPSREARESASYQFASCLRASGVGSERIGDTRGSDTVVAMSLNAHGQRLDAESETLIAFNGRMDPVSGEVPGALDRLSTQCVAFDLAQITSATNRTRAGVGLPASTMSKQSRMHVADPMAVRRLTPRECERLQGFPDDYTAIQFRGKPACDGPRYKALGNSMATPVVQWIGKRIELVEQLQ